MLIPIIMKKTQAIEILYKYKDYLPFDYENLQNDLLDGNIEALEYVAYLSKHDNDINIRNYCKPPIRTRRPGQMVDDNLIYTRLNFTVYSDNLIRFDGYY